MFFIAKRDPKDHCRWTAINRVTYPNSGEATDRVEILHWHDFGTYTVMGTQHEPGRSIFAVKHLDERNTA